jgi:hypothetical protein
MAVSKQDKTRKQKLNNFKNKQKRMNEQQTNTAGQQIPNQQLPEVREVPFWSSNDDLTIKGIEYETMYNGIMQMTEILQGVFGAAQSVMQRNLLEDRIKVRFEKLSETTLEDGTTVPDYIPMTEEEQRPHLENFNSLVAKVKQDRDAAMKSALDSAQEHIQSLNEIVNVDGEPIRLADKGIVDAAGQPISSN